MTQVQADVRAMKADAHEANARRPAILIEANLQDANLFGANLEGANLYGANLHAAILTGANLQKGV